MGLMGPLFAEQLATPRKYRTLVFPLSLAAFTLCCGSRVGVGPVRVGEAPSPRPIGCAVRCAAATPMASPTVPSDNRFDESPTFERRWPELSGRMLADRFEVDYIVSRGVHLDFYDTDGNKLLNPHEENNRRGVGASGGALGLTI